MNRPLTFGVHILLVFNDHILLLAQSFTFLSALFLPLLHSPFLKFMSKVQWGVLIRCKAKYGLDFEIIKQR